MKHLFSMMIAASLALASASVNAQILEPMEPAAPTATESAPAPNADEALKTLCQLHASLYQMPTKYYVQWQSLEKHREAAELDTVRMEQQKKLDPDATDYPGRSSNDRFYSAQFTQEPSMCAQLDAELNKFITQHEAEYKSTVTALIKATNAFTDEQKADFAKRLTACTIPTDANGYRKAHQVLYACIYRIKNIKNVPLSYSVEKTMRRLYVLQEPLLTAWLGSNITE